METSTQDRLKAFLGRNRNKNVNPVSEKEEGFTILTANTPTRTQTKIATFQFADGFAPLSTRSAFNNDQNGCQDESSMPDLFTPAFEKKVTYADDENVIEGGDGLDFSLGKDRRTSSEFSLGSPASFAQKEVPKEIKSSIRVETEDNRANGRVSPIREGNKSGRNMIENYVSQRKSTEMKLRNTLRSGSRETKKFLTPSKSNAMYSTINSNSSTAMSVRSEVPESQGSLSARQSRTSKVSSRDFSQSDAKQKTQKQVKPLKQMNNSLFSSGTKKPKEEKREFEFEETPIVLKGNNTSRNNSRSKDPLRPSSLTPRGLRTQEKKPLVVPQQSAQQQKSDKGSVKSHLSTPKHQQKEFFPESSKRLQALDSSSNSEAKFKKEIKSLIQIIKQEKDQITEDLQSMSKELSKYKAAYKQLKKQLDKQAKDFAEKMQASSNRSEPHSEGNTVINDTEQLANQENRSPQKRNSIKDNQNSKPFTIEELTNHLDKNISNLMGDDHIELLSKMKNINSDVENIVARAKTDFSLNKENFASGSNVELQSFQLRKNAVNNYIIKEMNLAFHIFFQDNVKEIEGDTDFKPTVIDLLAAQREIIHFLIRKLEVEEKQRLKTEEQASLMIIQVEKSLKQMEDRGPTSRKKEPNSSTEVNKSINSQG